MPAPAPSGTQKPTVLFDLDGTLLDSIELILSSARYSFQKMNREWISDDEWRAGIGIPLFTMFRRYATGETEAAAFLAAYREYQLPNHDRLIRCYDDVADTVKLLHGRGHELAVVTSKSDALAMRGLVHVGLARYIDTIVGSDSSKRHKPHPEPVQIALHRLDCRPEDAIFVGDSVHDLLAGNAAGVRTVAAVWGAFSRAALEPGNPTSWAERITDVVSVVDRWPNP